MDEHIKASKPKLISNEIDILDVLKQIWASRKTIYITLGISAIIGLIVAFTSPRQYKVVTTMLPQSESESSLGNISSLAAIAGFDIDMSDGGSDISPVIYPQILESETFLLKLMHSKYTFKSVDHPISLYDYLTKYQRAGPIDVVKQYTIGLPALIKMSMKKKAPFEKPVDDGLTHVSMEEDMIANNLKSAVTLTLNKKEGYLTLTCIFDEALLSAQVAKKAQALLQETITSYKTKRATEQLAFFEKRYNEKKREYEIAQNRLAGYKDRNLFVTSAIGSSSQERLQNDYNLAFSVYSELAKQLESAKIKVKRTTPAYIILKPVVVPLEPFAPRKNLILIVFLLIGGAIGFSFIFLKKYLTFLKITLQKKEFKSLAKQD